MKKKAIIIYTNVDGNEAEQKLIDFYLERGYTPMVGEKKKGITVKEMREDMESTDKNALAEFNKLYAEKNGFHSACKYYTKWKKENK